MTQHVLNPATEVEAEMAGVARACIKSASDQSKAETVKLIFELEDAKVESQALLPPTIALSFLPDFLGYRSSQGAFELRLDHLIVGKEVQQRI